MKTYKTTPRRKFSRPGVAILIAGLAIIGLVSYGYQSGKISFSSGQPAEAAPLRGVHSDESKQIASMRRAGITGDRTQVPAMIAVLSDPSHPHPLAIRTALHALAQLGATEALPFVDAVAQSKTLEPDYVKVVRQRLLAESDARSTADTNAQAATKISTFYSGLGLTPDQLNAATASLQSGSPKQPGLHLSALREIADMAYHGIYNDYAALPGVKQLNFQQDYPSALKIRLAPLARVDRVNAMIDDLAHTQSIGPKQKYEMQLLDDEGILASHAAAAQLQQMDSHRNQYPREGFEAIFSVLSGAGDSTQAPLVDHYTQDQDGYIAYFASNAYPDVKAGHSGIFAPEY